MAASGFFMWRRRSPSPGQLRFAWLTDLVRAIHADSRGTYGWRRVDAELTYGHGVIVDRKTVRKIMRIESRHGIPGSPKTFPSKVNTATAPIWSSAAVLEVFSRRVVGWSIDSHQATPLDTDALGMAINNRNPRTRSHRHP